MTSFAIYKTRIWEISSLLENTPNNDRQSRTYRTFFITGNKNMVFNVNLAYHVIRADG